MCELRWGRGIGMKSTTYSKGQDCPQVWSLLLIVPYLPVNLLVYQPFLIFRFYLHVSSTALTNIRPQHSPQHLEVSFHEHTWRFRSIPNVSTTFGLPSPPQSCVHIYGPYFSHMFNVSPIKL